MASTSIDGALEELGVRYKFKVGEENCYMILGESFLHITLPFENRVEYSALRGVLDSVCEAFEQAQVELQKQKNLYTTGNGAIK